MLAQITIQIQATFEEGSGISPESLPQVLIASPGRAGFLIVLIGVIVGHSIGKLFGFVGDFLVHRRNAEASLPHGLFLISLFIYQIYYWWDMWEIKDLAVVKSDTVNFFVFFRLVLIPVCLYCATALFCPKLDFPSGSEKLSLGKYFDEQCRPIYFLWILICLIGALQAHDLRGESFTSPAVLIRFIAAALFLLGFIVRRPWMNYFLAFMIFLILIAYISLPFWAEWAVWLRAVLLN